MADKIQLINLDDSFPIQDAHHAGNTSGTIRFIDASDPWTLEVFQRLQGDLVNRSKLIEGKINSIIDFINKNPILSGFDDAPFLRTDGSRALTKAQSCATLPTDDAHLTNKKYVDDIIEAAELSVTTLSASLDAYKLANHNVYQSRWTEYEWQAGKNTTIELQITGTFNADAIASVRVMEKLDIAQVTEADPNPEEVLIYRELSRGTKGFALDDFWYVESTKKVKVLIPNLVSYEEYSGSGNTDLQAPRTRWLKAIITAKSA